MPLTPGDRQRILDEERARREARQRVRMEEIRNAPPMPPGCWVAVVIVAVVIVLLLAGRCGQL